MSWKGFTKGVQRVFLRFVPEESHRVLTSSLIDATANQSKVQSGKYYPPPKKELHANLVQGENTKDPIYIDAERRFSELEKETKRLHDESQK